MLMTMVVSMQMTMMMTAGDCWWLLTAVGQGLRVLNSAEVFMTMAVMFMMAAGGE